MDTIHSTDDYYFKKATSVAILTVSVLMIVAAAVFYIQGKGSNYDEEMVMHTYQVTGHIQLLFNRIKDVELGQRGYIIAGDEKYLASYYEALKDSLGEDAKSTGLEQHHSVAEELKILRNLAQDNPTQLQNLDEMDSTVNDLMQYWAAAIQSRHDNANMRFDFSQGNQLMEHARKLVGIMMAEENRLLSTRIVADKSSTYEQYVLIFSGMAIFYLAMVINILMYQKRRKEAHKTQAKLIERLASSNTELERFAYVASHDMQEPLRMIANFGLLLGQEYGTKLDEEGKEYVHIVTQSALRMQDMVNDLLEYARIGSEAMRFVAVNATEELLHVLENLLASIEENNAVVTYDQLPEIKGNPVQFMRLLQNLIGNGLKYQAVGATPKIHITAKDQVDKWRFAISDNGIGMPEDYVVQVFQPFKRLHTWDEYKGTGIGLAVCKRIVENHGGEIWLTSQPDKGSVFYFTIAK